MGLFAKTYNCSRCGSQFTGKLTKGIALCNTCLAKEEAKKNDLKGYIEYAKRMKFNPYNDATLDEIAKHRNGILEKYRITDGISMAELQNISGNYLSLSDEQAADIIRRMEKSSFSYMLGASFTGGFFIPSEFERVVVDAEDVFAVGYASDSGLMGFNTDVIVCAIFTNDPYIPVLPMMYAGSTGLFSFKSKAARQDIKAIMESVCPNLKYPVQELKQLKKQIKTENVVRGNINQKYMLDFISSATSAAGIFDAKFMHGDEIIGMGTASLLDQYGYILDVRMEMLLNMDKRSNRKYWEKQRERFSSLY